MESPEVSIDSIMDNCETIADVVKLEEEYE